ncbi:hypothetical protein [Corynebacterium bouchesdurhonense]|uniref:hypothetical protein n=1 Tax=Corynebacterium bouchesdurhonense TaxID=1720192 RepID=UPI00082D9273|nr:hypothetical protein [Corynebacterium bouchesdurhonense]
MAINLSIDLADATFADLVALVDAAHAAGVERSAPLELDGEQLTLAVEPGAAKPAAAPQTPRGSDGEGGHRPLPQLGDAAIRSVVDILTGRQEPPRR